MNAARRALVERYCAGYGAVVAALEDVDLDARPFTDGWTPRAVVHHLADSTAHAAVRLRRLLAEDRPNLGSYDEAQYAQVLHYDRPIASSLALFAALVESNAELLETLTDDEWERTGKHDEYPDGYSIDLWLDRQAAHVHEHADQISACKR